MEVFYGNENWTKNDEDFKKSLVSLHQNGKTQAQLCKEYGVSQSALGKWVKQDSTVTVDDRAHRRGNGTAQLDAAETLFERAKGSRVFLTSSVSWAICIKISENTQKISQNDD